MRVLLEVIRILAIARCTVLADRFTGHGYRLARRCFPPNCDWYGVAFPQLLVFVENLKLLHLSSLKMFTLFQGLWKYFFRKEEYYVVILGLDNAGKTVKVYIVYTTILTTPTLSLLSVHNF